jgi:hypothetical protein
VALIVGLGAAELAAEESESFVDALLNGKVKALFRYSAQQRNSNLHVLQDSTTPDISDEKTQNYSAGGGFIGYETRPWHDVSFGATVYGAVPGLSIQFRLASNNYRTDYDFEAYRAIHGYDFETATKDFWDVRIYLDYRF